MLRSDRIKAAKLHGQTTCCDTMDWMVLTVATPAVAIRAIQAILESRSLSCPLAAHHQPSANTSASGTKVSLASAPRIASHGNAAHLFANRAQMTPIIKQASPESTMPLMWEFEIVKFSRNRVAPSNATA